VSLNHFTVPVVRIAELLNVFVVGGTDASSIHMSA